MKLEFDIYEGEIRAKGFCDHCGNVTFQKVLHYKPVQEDGRIFTYSFSQCTICNGVILRRHFEDWDAPVPLLQEEDTAEDEAFEQLWPPSLSLPVEAPERVRQIYEEARLVRRHSPSSFVVQVGRALEAVMNDKGAQGRSLHQKINWLIEQGHIPRLFGEMGHLNRIIRNWGAHDTGLEVNFEDAEIVDEFFRAIIEYLYVAPAKVSKVARLVSERAQ